jgi:hypothetical protein
MRNIGSFNRTIAEKPVRVYKGNVELEGRKVFVIIMKGTQLQKYKTKAKETKINDIYRGLSNHHYFVFLMSIEHDSKV